MCVAFLLVNGTTTRVQPGKAIILPARTAENVYSGVVTPLQDQATVAPQKLAIDDDDVITLPTPQPERFRINAGHAI